MAELLAIPKICSTRAGISSIVILSPDNIVGQPTTSINATLTFVDPDKVYSIAFDRYTAKFLETGKTSKHGDYYDQVLTAFIPKRRIEMETLLSALRNRRIHAIYIDKNGTQIIQWNARLFHRYTTGDKPGTREGYTIQIKGSNIRNVPIISGNEDLPEPPPPAGPTNSCCITINPISVTSPPPPSGNVTNLNKIVTTIEGTPYFIDKNGRALVLGRPAPKYFRIPTTPDGLLSSITLPAGTLPDPDDFPFPTYDVRTEMGRRVWVKLSSRWIAYDPAPYAGGFTVDINGGVEKIWFDEAVEGAYIEVYVYSFPIN